MSVNGGRKFIFYVHFWMDGATKHRTLTCGRLRFASHVKPISQDLFLSSMIVRHQPRVYYCNHEDKGHLTLRRNLFPAKPSSFP